MQIGEIIRKYRKKYDMTQEEMAKRLGVTAPAVNKWENGNSLPDIMLLAPIARLLGITVDELLSFREELTEEEIGIFVQELDSRLKKDTYEEVFRWAKEKLEQYPNCEQLIWQTAVILDAWRRMRENAVSDAEDIGTENRLDDFYDSFIYDCYLRVLNSENEQLRCSAADSLFAYYSGKEQYDKAEEYLQYFSEQNPERKRKQAYICGKTERREEAYKLYEELLFSGYQSLSLVFNGLYQLAMEEQDFDKAHLYVEKQSSLAKLLELGAYQEILPELDLAVAKKDAERTLGSAEQLLECLDTMGVDSMCGYAKSRLYEHMSFRSLREEFVQEVKENLLENFRDAETFGFLQGDERWETLISTSSSE